MIVTEDFDIGVVFEGFNNLEFGLEVLELSS